MSHRVCVVVPNWNGQDSLASCLDSLNTQSEFVKIIVVDNGSSDDSVAIVEEKYPDVILIKHRANRGFAGGVNAGICYGLKLGAKYIGLLNNDATADKEWAKHLTGFLDSHPKAGIVTSKILDGDKKQLDSTGDLYTIWGLPFPRGRGEPADDKYDSEQWVFGASGGASLYRAAMFQEIGLFDQDFFAYYEDIDISFRAQLAGWKVAYEPRAIAYHQIGATSSKIYGFTTYQTAKNLPMLFWKNAPASLLWRIVPRFKLAYGGILFSAVRRGQGWPAFKGLLMFLWLLPKKTVQRHKIQKKRRVTTTYINSIITHDLPPNAHKLRALRQKWWKLLRKDSKSESL